MQNEQHGNLDQSNQNRNSENMLTQNNNLTRNIENTCRAVVAFTNIFQNFHETLRQEQNTQKRQHQEQQQHLELIQENQQQNQPASTCEPIEQEQNNQENQVTVNKSNTQIKIDTNIEKRKLQPIESMWSISSAICRICQIPEHEDQLISPCLCKGSLAYVHKHCLERWLSTSGMMKCELCHYQYKTTHKLRYSFWKSIRLWFSHPNNLGVLQADILVCSLLTIVSAGLIAISMLGLHYFSAQSARLGVSRIWSQFILLVFLSIIIAVYMVNVFVIFKSQISPWYHWWRSARTVTLLLENRKASKNIRSKIKKRNDVEREIQSTFLSRPNEINQTNRVPQIRSQRIPISVR